MCQKKKKNQTDSVLRGVRSPAGAGVSLRQAPGDTDQFIFEKNAVYVFPNLEQVRVRETFPLTSPRCQIQQATKYYNKNKTILP